MDTSSTPTLPRMLAAGKFDATRFVTHRFALRDTPQAYDVFSRPDQTGALTVILHRD